MGSRCGTGVEFEEAISLLSKGAIEVVVTGEYELERAVEAMERSLERDAVKVIVTNPR